MTPAIFPSELEKSSVSARLWRTKSHKGSSVDLPETFYQSGRDIDGDALQRRIDIDRSLSNLLRTYADQGLALPATR